MYIISMKEEGRKTPSLEINLLDLISFYNEDDNLKVDYSLLNKKLDDLESIISTFITSCFISSFITSMFVNIVVKYINDSLLIYDEKKDFKEKTVLIKALLNNYNCNNNNNNNNNSSNNNLIYQCVENQGQSNQVSVNSNSMGNQENQQEENNDDNNDDNYENNNDNGGGNGEMNNNSNGEMKTENGATENDLAFEPPTNESLNQFINQNKEFNKSIIPSLYHRSSTGSLKKSKLLGAIGSKDDTFQMLGKDGDFIGSNHIDSKNVHLIHELSSNNINKMPSIIEDRTEEGSDIEDMKMILKKDQNKKKGDKLSKLLINKPGEGSVDESKKEDGNYASLPYSPFSNNFDLWKNNIVDSLPYRSSASGLGSHRNSICCPYDIITNFCTSNNVRRGSLPALNYSYHNNSNLTTSSNINTPPHSSCQSSASSLSSSSSSSSSSASSSLSSPSSNSTMVNQSNNNDGHPYSFNKLNFNNTKIQKSGGGASTQISSSSTPSIGVSDIAKGKHKYQKKKKKKKN
ncbi:hypothetical protein PIROE2DRAFT_64758 [Piromyces sp. E2]|nr:hypothetical protein PIROE2DRAFT_64758 [Piromyces sp. E2]|eukprot:OUM57877.1 hypothetical protein PIROE2DRAFT_64758 [Piromyces sp. E2]